MKFYLCDTNLELVNNWKEYFSDYDNFSFYHGNIFDLLKNMNEEYMVVSPANSFGDMQGGIDLEYYTKFGYKLEEELQKKIIEEKYGELVVGDALILRIPDSKNYLISAPTMRVPSGIVNTINVYLAFRAILIQIKEFNENNENKVEHIFVPGLGTGIGKVSPEICARQMHSAYSLFLNPRRHLDLVQLTHEHVSLFSNI
jgi:O-acetyl-ADP-ribose deacetylase (regulator of RNase III)